MTPPILSFRLTLACVAASCAVVLTGCSITGYDAKSSFSCAAPQGVLCDSMSGIYANTMAKNLPEQRVHTSSGAATNVTLGDFGQSTSGASSSGTSSSATRTAFVPGVGAQHSALSSPLDSGLPIHTAPREMRVWFAPWKDSDADLHDQEYVYLIVDYGHWSIEHNQGRIRNAFRPVLPPDTTPSPVGAGDTSAPKNALGLEVPPQSLSPGEHAMNAGPSEGSSLGAAPTGNDPYAAKYNHVMRGIVTPDAAINRAATLN